MLVIYCVGQRVSQVCGYRHTSNYSKTFEAVACNLCYDYFDYSFDFPFFKFNPEKLILKDINNFKNVVLYHFPFCRCDSRTMSISETIAKLRYKSTYFQEYVLEDSGRDEKTYFNKKVAALTAERDNVANKYIVWFSQQVRKNPLFLSSVT